MTRRYSDQEISRAILLIEEEGLPIAEVAAQTGINYRALYRYRDRYIKGKQPPKQRKKENEIVVYKENTLPTAEVQQRLDKTMIERAKFLDDVFDTKKVLLERLKEIGIKSNNVDALQKAIKTLSDIEKSVEPDGDHPSLHADTVNMFQFFNQKLIAEGYTGPELTDADIAKGY